MDSDKLLQGIDAQLAWLNGERLTAEYRQGYSDALAFFNGCIIALEAAEEAEDIEEAKREYILSCRPDED